MGAVYVVGTMDTKAAELLYAAQRVRAAGAKAVLVDVGTRGASDAADVAAALGGILIPLTLHRLKYDPAVASSPFVTTVTDVVGFFSFLGIATLWFGLR